jgi:hypothetical protein
MSAGVQLMTSSRRSSASSRLIVPSMACPRGTGGASRSENYGIDRTDGERVQTQEPGSWNAQRIRWMIIQQYLEQGLADAKT